MAIFACGVNHKTAPIALREKIVFAAEELPAHLRCLLARGIAEEAVILSTCNRTEIYCVCDDVDQVYAWLLEQHDIDSSELRPSLYAYEGLEAVSHLMRVACGLDSMVLGEPQILGQVKTSFAKACAAEAIGPHLERLFPRVFSVAKKVRTHTTVGACPVSLASMAVRLAKQKHDALHDKHVMVIGAGETGALAAKHFFEEGVRQLTIASRSLERSELLVDQLSGVPIEIGDIFTYMPEVDIVVSATASSLPLIHKDSMQKHLGDAHDKSLLMLDIAVPRDIEPDAAELDYVELYSIDDLQETIEQHISDRKHAANKAEQMVLQHAEDFMHWQDSLDAAIVIRAYRQYVESLRDEEVKKALEALNSGQAAEEVIQSLARNLSNKFMHKPSVSLKKAGYDGRFDLIELMHKLYEFE